MESWGSVLFVANWRRCGIIKFIEECCQAGTGCPCGKDISVMRRKLAYALTIAAVVIFGVFGFLREREAQYNAGKAQGYVTGYSIGYTDAAQDIWQQAQVLAGEIVPYEFGSSAWKGFLMGFEEGYSDARKG